MKAETIPTTQQFAAAFKQQIGYAPTPGNGVHAVARRGRFFRVKYAPMSEQDTGRPVSKHYYMPHGEDFNGTGLGFGHSGVMLELGDWAHLLFEADLPAKLKTFDGEAKTMRASWANAGRVPPFEYVTYDCDTVTKYRLIVYGAYNAMGLIGCEHNGLALLDNERKEVVCDRMLEGASGWGGSTALQRLYWVILSRLMLEDADGFARAINEHFGVSRLRTEVRS